MRAILAIRQVALAVTAVFLVASVEGQAPPAAQPTRFPDFGFLPPLGQGPGLYNGPLFRLSQDYPRRLPSATNLPEFFKTDFRSDWRAYLLQVRDYCFYGNIDADWRAQDNKRRNWYHMPWQHYGPAGREGIRGLTKEAPVKPKQLALSQDFPNAVIWAVALYNEYAGYTIGRVWRNPNKPDPSLTTAPNGFANGSVICKLLFVSLPADKVATQVPSLINPIQWEAFVTASYASQDRSIAKVSLIQMDIMVRDNRAPSGWIFGTFQYNGALARANRWENLVPVGVMWGDDPSVTIDASNPEPALTIINPDIKESIINPDAQELPPTHLGWNGRLNGPVDNPRSSCYSCHATAQYEARSAITPFFEKNPPAPGSVGWMRWFQNNKCGQPFDEGQKSTDFSLQLAISIQNFHTWHDTRDGVKASTYAAPGGVAGAFAVEALPGLANKGGEAPATPVIYPIVRDLPE